MDMLAQAFPVFLLILCRITAFFVAAPVFSSRGVPNHFKVGLAVSISLIAYLLFGLGISVPMDGVYVTYIIREIMIGLLIGFVAQLFFTIVQITGSFVDMQIGFGIANVVDPLTGMSSPITGNFKYIFMILLFLGMNGHHYLIDAIMKSYQWLPIDSNSFFGQIQNGNIMNFVVITFVQAFIIALQIAAPLIVSMFLADVALGFLAKTAPQFNIFVIGIPLKIILGLVVLLLTMPSMVYVMEHLFSKMFQALDELLRLFAKGGAS
ncbi:flagellar biosynthetic protein FliR [Paenibacillus assamensis]|uniref:flagellar biosynthetic protein FliR n=1 Tax=Paenibacillus assamensis TaxID=311244 RepID=UPI0004134AD7|nr:flagellar biosynthetic protein FliR [Paenibacillus assamensis]